MSKVNWLALKVKSSQQYNHTLVNLRSLGLVPKMLTGLKDSNADKLYIVFKINSHWVSDGTSDGDDSDVQIYTKRKEFIAAVKQVLGESK